MNISKSLGTSLLISVQPVIISYNNPSNLATTLDHLTSLSSLLRPVVIFENGSPLKAKQQIHSLADKYLCNIINSSINRGWGGAINYILDNHWKELGLDDCVLLIMAHDSYFLSFNLLEVAQYFKDPLAIFVCPAYPEPVTNHYNIFKSYYSKPGKAKGLIKIGHQTAFFASPSHLKRVRFDHEFWLYGAEYEIFTRANQAGYRSYQCEDTVIVNPSTDSASETCLLAYKLNSLYCAFKRHGPVGLYVRSIVIFISIVNAYLFGNRQIARYLFQCLCFSLANPGCGHNTYRTSSSAQVRYAITPLNK